MPKFLIEATYTAQGLKGLQKDGASGRLAAVTEAVRSLGGTVESMHYALGKNDTVILVELPDAGAVAALGAAVVASGMARTHATALLTIAEMDQALSRNVSYRGPGQ